MARRAISIFDDGCGAPQSTVCFWLMLVISALPVLRVGPPAVKVAVNTAIVVLGLIYDYHCKPAWKRVGSPAESINELETQIIEADKDFDVQGILDRTRATLSKEV